MSTVLLTITTTSSAPLERPASDVGFVLHKHPDRVRTVDLSFGHAHVFWPEASPATATVALLVEVDPVALVRNRRGPAGEAHSLTQYVNDRPYAASSFLSVALGRAFGTALAGNGGDRPELAATAIPLRIELPAVPCRGGEAVLRRLFEPLGYTTTTTAVPLDPAFPAWGNSRYLGVVLEGEQRVADALAHLYVLLPVLDDDKHYWVAADEIDKLLRRGGEWLGAHPDRDLIVRRYLRHRGRLTADAIARLTDDEVADPDADADKANEEEAAVEDRISLNEQRINAVVAEVAAAHARRVVDLGCGEGRLLQALLRQTELTKVAGMDVSPRSLQNAARRLRLDEMNERRRARIELFQGSLTYRDARLSGFDAATLVEVIEHLDPGRLDALERVVFGAARPPVVIVTTPNREYNVRWETLPAGMLRHRDHRFEWTRDELRTWADAVAARRGYAVRYAPIGPDDPEVGAPTQMAVFTR
jgi:3' terminal RNA ribose 2'-O-methyltransferase Hen1